MKTWPEFTIIEVVDENPAFKAWLQIHNPDWQSEYSGNIYAMLLAWKAGYDAGIEAME